jgi:hypothetical protein
LVAGRRSGAPGLMSKVLVDAGVMQSGFLKNPLSTVFAA